jgi:glycine/D-amino acid oxidase-like deaminating enzyme/nitrite reductase/ring-hydroxylating ferredoxin subunit
MASIWQASAGGGAERRFPVLDSGVEADVAIIGAGITGLTTALAMTETGQRVVVLEAGRVGGANTGDSTGNLYATLSEGLSSLRSRWDDQVLAEVVDARSRAVDAIAATVERFGIDCDFQRQPLYFVAPAGDGEQRDWLSREEAACSVAGLPATRVTDVPLPFPGADALRIDGQAQFNPSAYVRGLADAVSGLGVSVYEETRVVEVSARQGVVLKTATGIELRAREVVYATHTPLGVNILQTVMIPAREYGISARLRDRSPPEGIFWVRDPFHSLRSYEHDGARYLVVVGEKHKTGEDDLGRGRYQRLRDYVSAHFDVDTFEHAWSAQQYASGDGLPYIGRTATAADVMTATGFGANGLVWGTVAGNLLGDLLRGRENPWAERFSARRFTPVKSAAQWFKENVSVAGHMVSDRLGRGRYDNLEQLAPGEGGIVSVGGERLAAYRRPSGELSTVSAVCPHMKCLVHWNGADDTWDCPCHGSRFNVDGSVIEGPALHPLMPRTPG